MYADFSLNYDHSCILGAPIDFEVVANKIVREYEPKHKQRLIQIEEEELKMVDDFDPLREMLRHQNSNALEDLDEMFGNKDRDR